MIGKSLAHYKIIDKLGEGGMGVVFRAHDSKLEREVAIKILPQEMSGDPERAARFAREARTLASLQHANIASVYGYEEAEGTRFLVMELIEGEDLDQRAKRGAIPVDEAIDIATQIAIGLEAAHDQNIIHRDLKPANIKVTPTGEVKILDFGLARAYLGDDGEDPDMSQSPTITAAMTGAGVILGTAAYMSPEQARGKPVDKRSDMWAFGVILFEMLTGERLFRGETVSDTLASVLRKEPDFDKLPKIPPAVHRLLRRCLQRDLRQRIRSAGDAGLELTDTEDIAATVASGKSGAPIWMWGLIGVLAIALAASMFMRPSGNDSQPARTIHVDVAMPDGQPVAPIAPSLSPDGRWLAFVVRDSLNQNVLYLRSLERNTTELVQELGRAAVTGGGALFWSPDSKRLGIQNDKAISHMEIDTRSVQTLLEGMAAARGASWSRNDDIIYSPSANSGIFATDAFGTPGRSLTAIDSSLADASHRWPVFLPDGRQFLFTVWSNAQQEQEEIGGIYLSSLDGDEPVRILNDASQVVVDPTGYLLFHRNGKLMYVRFDFDKAEMIGNPVRVADDVTWDPNNGMIMVAVSDDGQLVIGSGGRQDISHTLGVLERDGSFDGRVEIPGGLFDLSVSSDGRHACLNRVTQGSSIEIWTADLERRTLSRLSRFGSDCWGSVFSPDKSEVAYSNQDPGWERVYAHGVDGATAPRALFDIKSVNTTVSCWSADGQIFFEHDPRDTGISEIGVYDTKTEEIRMLLTAEFDHYSASLSPDGRWLAYTSEESGRPEIFIRPYPALNRKWQISTEGGDIAHWRDDSKELMFQSAPGRFYAVQIAVVDDRLEPSSPIHISSFDNEFQQLVPDAKHERFFCGRVSGARQAIPFHYISNWRASAEASN